LSELATQSFIFVLKSFIKMNILNSDNYKQGFLVDDECMAGVTQDPENSSNYVAYVLRHTTGEYLGYHPFTDLNSALSAINQIRRSWNFEQVGGCGGCGKAGQCSKGGCGKGKCGTSSKTCQIS
jgi:hypothetical protein